MKGHSTKKISPQIREAIRKAIFENPLLTSGLFLKQHPDIKISTHTYYRYRNRFLKESGRKTETLKRQYNKKNLYQNIWECPLDEFTKNSIAGLNSFLEKLSMQSRASFELIKTEKLEEGKWVSYLEIRES